MTTYDGVEATISMQCMHEAVMCATYASDSQDTDALDRSDASSNRRGTQILSRGLQLSSWLLQVSMILPGFQLPGARREAPHID